MTRPITVLPAGVRVVVEVDDLVIADTTGALTLQEADHPVVLYVPLADVDPALLTPSDTVTFCPYKGEAEHFGLRGPDGPIPDAAWTYREPYEQVAAIAGHVAFYPDKVQVSVPGFT